MPFEFMVLDAKEDLYRVGKLAINPHKVKNNKMYLEVASWYDCSGYKGQ